MVLKKRMRIVKTKSIAAWWNERKEGVSSTFMQSVFNHTIKSTPNTLELQQSEENEKEIAKVEDRKEERKKNKNANY